MNKIGCKNDCITWNLLWLGLFAIGMGIFLIGMPKYLDDCLYLNHSGDWLHEQGVVYLTDGINIFNTGLPWAEIKQTLWEHWWYDNMRFANIAVIPFLFLPKYIGSGICLIAWIYTVITVFNLLGINWRRTVLFVPALFLWYFFMPWQDHMGILDFQFNYLIPTAFSLYLLSLIKNFRNRKIDYLKIFLVAIITGGWHEGFSIPILCGFIVCAIFFKEARDWKYIIAMFGLGMGIMWLLIVPGMWQRYQTLDQSYYATTFQVLKRLAKTILVLHPVIFIFLVCEIILIIKTGLRQFIRDRFSIWLNIEVCSAMLLACFSTGELRAGWWGDMCAIIGILYFIVTYWNKWLIENKCVVRFIVICCILSTGLSLCLTDIFVIKTSRECRKVIDQFMISPYDTIYNEWLGSMDRPVFMLTKFDNYPTIYQRLVSQFHLENGELSPWEIKIVSSILKKYLPEEALSISGNGNVKTFHGFYIMEIKKEEPVVGNVEVETSCRTIPDLRAHLIPFKSDRDGKDYCCLILADRNLERYLFGVKSIGEFKH